MKRAAREQGIISGSGGYPSQAPEQLMRDNVSHHLLFDHAPMDYAGKPRATGEQNYIPPSPIGVVEYDIPPWSAPPIPSTSNYVDTFETTRARCAELETHAVRPSYQQYHMGIAPPPYRPPGILPMIGDKPLMADDWFPVDQVQLQQFQVQQPPPIHNLAQNIDMTGLRQRNVVLPTEELLVPTFPQNLPSPSYQTYPSPVLYKGRKAPSTFTELVSTVRRTHSSNDDVPPPNTQQVID